MGRDFDSDEPKNMVFENRRAAYIKYVSTGSQKDANCRPSVPKYSVPRTVEVTFFIDALKAMRAEEIALTLNNIGRTLRLREAVEVAQC